MYQKKASEDGMISCMKNFAETPKVSLPSDIYLEGGEKVVLGVRQHWVVFRNSLLLMFFVPFVLLSMTFFLDYIPISEMVRNILSIIALYGTPISFGLGLFLFLWRFYLWNKTIYILTNKRLILITQKNFFSHDDREIGLDRVQDVQASVEGLQAALYGYGNVRVQVSSEDSKIILEKVAHPREVQHEIVRETHLTEN